MLYEVCYRALSSIFVVEATHGRVARGGVLARPGGPAALSFFLSRSHRDQSIFSDGPPLYPLNWLSGGPTR